MQNLSALPTKQKSTPRCASCRYTWRYSTGRRAHQDVLPAGTLAATPQAEEHTKMCFLQVTWCYSTGRRAHQDVLPAGTLGATPQAEEHTKICFLQVHLLLLHKQKSTPRCTSCRDTCCYSTVRRAHQDVLPAGNLVLLHRQKSTPRCASCRYTWCYSTGRRAHQDVLPAGTLGATPQADTKMCFLQVTWCYSTGRRAHQDVLPAGTLGATLQAEEHTKMCFLQVHLVLLHRQKSTPRCASCR